MSPVFATTTSEAWIDKVLNGLDAELQALVKTVDVGRHVLGIQLEGLASVVVHPVPDDVSMKNGLPRGLVFGILKMSLVTMDVYLYGSDAPPLIDSI